MFYRLRTQLNKRWFDWRARGIRATPAVRCDTGSRVIVLTQLHHPDVTMFMVAAKSFCRHLRPGGFVIVDDGLTPEDRALLSSHFENLRFVRTSEARGQVCPAGGCWERLLSIADLNDKHYVIQLDADTLTLARPDEVLACVEAGTSFTLGTTGGQHIIDTAEASRIAAGWRGQHVQVVAEQALSRLPATLGTRYVHGCAGFAGFAPGTMDRRRVEAVSAAMAAVVPPAKWAEWGSEQVTSNFIVANTPGAVVLPPRRYPFWQQGVPLEDVRVVHFFGTHRFEAGRYVAAAAHLSRELMRA